MPASKILIIEDDWIIAKELQLNLQDLGLDVVGLFDNAEDALLQIVQLQPDLVILDIALAGKMNGIEAGSEIKKKYPHLPFLFLTAQADISTIEKAKLADPAGYLVKPIGTETLYSTIEITLYQAQKRKEDKTPDLKEQLTIHDSVFVKTKGRLEKICLRDVLWIEASDIYTLLCTSQAKHLLNTSLKSVEEKFPTDFFIRVHRSYIIQLEKIDAIEDDEILIAQQRIPIGKTYRDKLMQRINTL